MQTLDRHDSNVSLLLANESRRASILKDVSDALGASGIPTFANLISAADVSAQDVVEAFGDENSMVVALADTLAAEMVEPLDACAADASFRHTLCALVTRVTDESLASKFRRLCQIALTGVTTDTDLVSELYRRGPEMVTAELARFFDEAQAGGAIRSQDSHQLARHLMALLSTSSGLADALPFVHLIGCLPARDVSQMVELFCAGVHVEVNDACTAV